MIADTLPKPQVQALQFPYIISYFLQNCKKSQIPEKGFAFIKKRYHNQLKRCQNERYIAEYQNKCEHRASPASRTHASRMCMRWLCNISDILKRLSFSNRG